MSKTAAKKPEAEMSALDMLAAIEKQKGELRAKALSELAVQASEAVSEIERIAKLYASLGAVDQIGIALVPPLTTALRGAGYAPSDVRQNESVKPQGEKGIRIRRTAEALKTDALAIVEIVKSAGKAGVAATDLKPKMEAQGIAIQGSLKDFVLKHSGVELRTEGEKRAAVYFLK
jgi:hypothetical protein